MSNTIGDVVRTAAQNPSAFSSRRPRSQRRLWALVLVGLLGLGVVERAIHSLAARSATTWPAFWIWAPVGGASVRDEVAPEAFYAFRDFELEEVPEGATLSIAADEEYQLFVNGWRVGSGCYDEEGSLDSYLVSDLLVQGRNRVAVEARSRFGFGGMIALLEDPAQDATILVTDGSWRVVSTQEKGIVSGVIVPDAWDAPEVFGRARIGRWRVGRSVMRPRLDGPGELVEAPSVERVSWQTAPSGGGHAGTAESASETVVRRGTIIDFGREVTGYLELWLRGRDARRIEELPSVVYSLEEPVLGDHPPLVGLSSEDAVVVTVLERPFWRDVMPRTFRYVYLRGNRRVELALVEIRSAQDRELAWQDKKIGVQGPFGLKIE